MCVDVQVAWAWRWSEKIYFICPSWQWCHTASECAVFLLLVYSPCWPCVRVSHISNGNAALVLLFFCFKANFSLDILWKCFYCAQNNDACILPFPHSFSAQPGTSEDVQRAGLFWTTCKAKWWRLVLHPPLWRVNVIYFLIKVPCCSHILHISSVLETRSSCCTTQTRVLPSTEWFDEWIFWTNLFCELILVICFFQMNCFWHSYRRDQEGFKTQSKFIEVRTFVFSLLGLPGE